MILIISTLITLIYLFLICLLVYGLYKVEGFSLKNTSANTRFSVIVPFRNEAKNLPNILQSISGFQYPKHLYEIIFIDDASEDHSVDLIMGFLTEAKNDIKIISNKRKTNSPKKDAITKAIAVSKYEWIITTDADCHLPKHWLESFDQYIQKTSAKCLVAPVTYNTGTGILENFQLLNVLSLQGATAGGFGIDRPFLCNGANLGYQKDLFYELNGFNGNTNIASGDDVFFLEKAIKTYKNNVHYLKSKDAIVTTYPEATWPKLFSQQMRWAAKTSASTNGFGKLVAFVVFLMNANIALNFTLLVLGLTGHKSFLYILIIKFCVDMLLISKTASFFNQKKKLKYYVFGFLIYPFFSVLVAISSTFASYKWKERRYKK